MDGKNLAVDAVALAVYAVVANPAVTGIALHEWLGLGLFVVFVVHAALHADWVADALRTAFSRPTLARTGNLVLDLLIVVVLMAVAVSGVMVSGAVLPTFGWYAQGYYFWDPLHAVSAKALLALLLVHVVVHGKWIAAWFKKRKGDKHE